MSCEQPAGPEMEIPRSSEDSCEEANASPDRLLMPHFARLFPVLDQTTRRVSICLGPTARLSYEPGARIRVLL